MIKKEGGGSRQDELELFILVQFCLQQHLVSALIPYFTNKMALSFDVIRRAMPVLLVAVVVFVAVSEAGEYINR